MTRVILDAAMRSQLLKGRSESLEICDESGRLIGYFTPVSDSLEEDREMPPLSDEEIERRLNEPTFSTAEVLTHLKQR
jgi:hypothetical protein